MGQAESWALIPLTLRSAYAQFLGQSATVALSQ
jgi:hypothetical protein